MGHNRGAKTIELGNSHINSKKTPVQKYKIVYSITRLNCEGTSKMVRL